MAGAKNHDYHILPPSIWPLFGSMSALLMAAGGIAWMHTGHVGHANGTGWVFFIGLAGVLFTMYSWWAQVIAEAHAGDHTPVVQLHFRYGMILFIASEVMFFVGWFWAFFDFSLFPTAMTFADGQVTRATEGAAAIVAQWPPKGLEVINPFAFPAAQHADPADQRHNDHLGAPCADPWPARRREDRRLGADRMSATATACSRGCG